MRKIIQYAVQDEGRDQGKVFSIREMSAAQAEKWAIRAFLAMGKNGIDLPEGIETTGFAGIARMGLGLVCKMPFDEAEPLLDEMMACVQFIPNPAKPNIIRPLVEDDIEEVATRLKLRIAVFKLHADFSSAAAPLTSGSALAAGKSTASSNT